MSGFEQVVTEAEGVDKQGRPVMGTTWTGRLRRPESVDEWRAQRLAALGHATRALPAGRALAELLEAGEDADVKSIGRGLDGYGLWAVTATLDALLDKARSGYPPAVPFVTGLRGAWTGRWGDSEPRRPLRDWTAKRVNRPRAASMADAPPDAAAVAAAWEGLSGPLPAGGFRR